MYLSKVRIILRKSILDPQGKAVQRAAQSLGVKELHEVRMGKYIELKLDAGSETEARMTVEEVCRKLLANPVMEDFHIEVEKI